MDIKGPGYRIQPAHCRHTVAVQRAICALNRNALWNNARLPLVTKNITAVAQSVPRSWCARCRGLSRTFFLCLVDPPCPDRIWNCLPNESLFAVGYSLPRTVPSVAAAGGWDGVEK